MDSSGWAATSETGSGSGSSPSGCPGGCSATRGSPHSTCRRTLAHVVDCLVWYAAHLARRTSGDVEVPEMDRNATAPVLLDALRSGGALLAAVVERADPTDRGWHPFGIADRSGFAAMGCDEALIHGADIAAGLGVGLDPAPPSVLCERVLRRLFPWAPEGVDPWDALLWANGRQPLGDRPSDHRWLWHCAPLVEWTYSSSFGLRGSGSPAESFATGSWAARFQR